MFPYHYVATTCGRQGSGRLKLENGLTVLTNTAIKILPEGKLRSFQLRFLGKCPVSYYFHLYSNRFQVKNHDNCCFLKASS